MVWCVTITNAQHTVILQVIDNQSGELTNNIDDNNETNVFCWAGNDDGTLYDGEWWFPMYDGEAGRTGAELIKTDSTWTWQCTFTDVAPGDYRWNPHMKTLGWKPINDIYTYGEDADINFSVADDGTISGQTTLELPLAIINSVNLHRDAIKIYSYQKLITLENVDTGSDVFVYNLQGRLIKKIKPTQNNLSIPISTSGIYLVRTNQTTSKVFIN